MDIAPKAKTFEELIAGAKAFNFENNRPPLPDKEVRIRMYENYGVNMKTKTRGTNYDWGRLLVGFRPWQIRKTMP